MIIQKKPFGTTLWGEKITLYILTNPNGMKAQIITYGAILVSLEVPDKNNNIKDITLGYDSLKDYIDDPAYFGAIVGRYAGLIGNGRFTINGKEYQLTQNEGEHHLHGGKKGFNKKVWKAEEVINEEGAGVKLNYLSKDGEEGYPGNLHCTVTYLLSSANNILKITLQTTTDKPTPVNLTHHSYFNLKGQGEGNILDHRLTLNASKYTPVNKELIPTGEIKSVKGTPLDFTQSGAIGSRIEELDKKFGGGYDHNFVLESGSDTLALAARVMDPENVRIMELYTTKPGLQFYTSNYLENIECKAGKVYKKHYGFCLEPQYFPHSPNNPNFSSSLLFPNEKRKEIIVYKFLITE